MLEPKIISTDKGDYYCLFQKGNNNKVAIVYYHGLEGKAKIVSPLLLHFKEYDFYSVEQRGHKNSFQKPSISVKKHDRDVKLVVNKLKQKYKKVFLMGESMGAVFTSRYGFKNNVDGVFCWSIPFEPKDIILDKKNKKFVIFLKNVITFFTGINYSYQSKIDYFKLTNSRFLLKLNNLDTQTIRQTSEAVAVWKAAIKLKKMFLNKKPQSPIYYWHGANDFMTKIKTLDKIKKNKFINFEIIPNAKHILMFEKESDIMFDSMINVIKFTI